MTTHMSCSISRTEVPCRSRIERSSALSSRDLARVEAGRRLVEAEQDRLGAHGARDLEPPLGAIGQVAGRIVGAVDRPICSSQNCACSTASVSRAPVAADAEQAEEGLARGAHQRVVLRDQQVLQHRHAGEQADVLEGARDPRLARDLVIGHALEQEEVAVGVLAAALPDAVSAVDVGRGATPSRASARRPSVGL